MTKINAVITGINTWYPEDKLTNADLEKIVDTNDEWITTRTGIKERRILKEPNTGASYMGVKAAKKLLKEKNISPETIDLIICTTVTPDMVFPSTACLIADKIGAKNAFAYDMNAACSGFLYGLNAAKQYIESGNYQKVLLISAEKMSAITNYTDRTTCILFGDAAAAVLIEPTTEDIGIKDVILRADGSGSTYLHMKAGGSLKPASHETVDNHEHSVYQEGQNVFKFAVTNMSETTKELMDRNKLTTEDVKWLVPHQANHRILVMTARRIGIPEERVMINIQKYGNTTSATIPLCLYEYQNQLKKGDNLLLTAFGGGFTWGSIWLKWGF